VKKRYAFFLPLIVLITGCSLTGDFTPPPALATSQGAQPLIQPTISPPIATTASEENSLENIVIQGSIQGQISNGSEGGSLPDGLEVTLYELNDQQEIISELTAVSSNGDFEFPEVEVQSARSFAATVEYQGVIYASEVASITEGAGLNLDIMIYETTTEIEDLQVDRIHVIFEVPMEGVLQVTELWILSNLGGRTIASESGDGILNIGLPDNAANLSFESGMVGTRFQVNDGGFIDLFPIYPGIGTQEIAFSFNMLLDQSLDFTQNINLPVEAVVLLTTEGVLDLMGGELQDTGLRQMTGGTLHSYSMGSLSPGDALELTVQRQINEDTTSRQSNTWVEIGIGVVFIFAAFCVIGFWFNSRKQGIRVEETGTRQILESESESEQEPSDREAIIQALADLDDQYEAGKIEEAFYRERRASLKNQLLDIVNKAGND